MKLRSVNKVFSRFGGDLRGVDPSSKLLVPKFLSIMSPNCPKGTKSPYVDSVKLNLKGKLSNSSLHLRFVRSYSTINASREMFIKNVRCYSNISNKNTDTKAVKVYTDLANNKVSLIKENNKLAGVYM
jgi:hypothetical protein